MAARVKMFGVAQMQRDLKRLFDEDRGGATVALKAAGKEAAEPVLARVRAELPNRTGNLRGTLRVSPTKTGANIRLGTKKYPYAGAVDFGGYPRPGKQAAPTGIRGVARRIAAFFGRSANPGGGRPYLPEGRYLYPAAKAEQGKVVPLYAAALQAAINAYPWSTPHE